MGKTAALKVHTAPFLDTPKGSAQSKKMSSSTSVANEAKECISPRTLLMWVHTSIEKWARKTDMLQNISIKCNVNMKSACLKNDALIEMEGKVYTVCFTEDIPKSR